MFLLFLLRFMSTMCSVMSIYEYVYAAAANTVSFPIDGFIKEYPILSYTDFGAIMLFGPVAFNALRHCGTLKHKAV